MTRRAASLAKLTAAIRAGEVDPAWLLRIVRDIPDDALAAVKAGIGR